MLKSVVTAFLFVLIQTLGPAVLASSNCPYKLLSEAELRQEVSKMIEEILGSSSLNNAQVLAKSLKEAANALVAVSSFGDPLVVASFSVIRSLAESRESVQASLPVKLMDTIAYVSYRGANLNKFARLFNNVSIRIHPIARVGGASNKAVAYVTVVSFGVVDQHRREFLKNNPQTFLLSPERKAFDSQKEYDSFLALADQIKPLLQSDLKNQNHERQTFVFVSRPIDQGLGEEFSAKALREEPQGYDFEGWAQHVASSTSADLMGLLLMLNTEELVEKLDLKD